MSLQVLSPATIGAVSGVITATAAWATAGLIKYDVAKSDIISPSGHTDIYCIGTLHFDSLDAIKTAFASPEGHACAADRKILAPGNDDVQIYLFDSVDV